MESVDKSRIDKEILPFLELLWDNGIESYMSCSGHCSEKPRIWFEDSDNVKKVLDFFTNKGLKPSNFIDLIIPQGDHWSIHFEPLILIPIIYPVSCRYHKEAWSHELVDKLVKRMWEKK